MKERSLWAWTSANALGLGLGFPAVLQTGFLIQFGLHTELYWTPQALGQGVSIYARLVGLLVGGAILGAAQAVALPARSVSLVGWVSFTAVGFGLVVAVMWPLWSAGLWGHIPGPVEPIFITVGGGTLAGILQYLLLRRRDVVATRWLVLWIGGLVASLAPLVLAFILLEKVLGLSLSWPVELGLNGFVVAGVAALISGRALFAVLSSPRDAPSPDSARTR